MADYGAIRDAVATIARKHGVERVSLFGSRARGDNRLDSDYDFLVTKGAMTTLWKFAAFWEDLERVLCAPADIVTEGTPDRDLLAEAKKDAVLLYERSH